MSDTPTLDAYVSFVKAIQPSSTEYQIKVHKDSYRRLHTERKHGPILPREESIVHRPLIANNLHEKHPYNAPPQIDVNLTVTNAVSLCVYYLGEELKKGLKNRQIKKMMDTNASLVYWLRACSDKYKYGSKPLDKTADRLLKLYDWVLARDASKPEVKTPLIETLKLLKAKDETGWTGK